MRVSTLFHKLLNLQGIWVTAFGFDGDDLVLDIRPRHRRLTCPKCGESKPGTATHSVRTRCWRHLGIWGRTVRVRGPIRRFRCRSCKGPVTESVPWARHDSDFTRPFEDAIGLLAQRTDKTTVSKLFSVAWRTVGNIAERLVDELLDPERLSQLRRIGVDEISFRKRHRYLTVVSDHDTGHVVWVGEGKCSETLSGFFHALPEEVRRAIEIVTMDMSQAYQKAVRESLPNAEIAFDHFHIAKLATEALNEVRRELAREARAASKPDLAKSIKGLRWPTSYSLANLPEKHFGGIARLTPKSKLGRAYLLKEELLLTLRRPDNWRDQLEWWMGWAARCRLAPFVKLGRTIRKHLAGIHAFMENLVSNARAEGINNKIRLLSHRAYGFHSAASLMAMVYLCCGGVDIPASLHLL